MLMQQEFPDAIGQALDSFRDKRDNIRAMWLGVLFDSPLAQVLAGSAPGDPALVRPHG